MIPEHDTLSTKVALNILGGVLCALGLNMEAAQMSIYAKVLSDTLALSEMQEAARLVLVNPKVADAARYNKVPFIADFVVAVRPDGGGRYKTFTFAEALAEANRTGIAMKDLFEVAGVENGKAVFRKKAG